MCLDWSSQDLSFPLLENANEYVVHGYAYSKYLQQLPSPGDIFSKGASLDKAFEGWSPVWAKARLASACIDQDILG